jgi:hypothetical protein
LYPPHSTAVKVKRLKRICLQAQFPDTGAISLPTGQKLPLPLYCLLFL